MASSETGTRQLRGPDAPRVGDEVVVLVGAHEVIGRVSRVTPHGVEVSFELPLEAGALGTPVAHATWRSGRESLFGLADASVVAKVSVLVDAGASAPEQRAYVRLDRRLAVDVALPGAARELATGSTQDLSTDGAKLKLNRGLKKGERVAVTLHLDEGALTTDAEVLRHRALKEGGHEVAVKFDMAPGDARSRLVRYVFARMRPGLKR
ncbi:MAG: PilZ domain-containing protein [Candidatus Sericytochromatia bacterium]|nr:PilZ domain-containing protein [Candidatus Tanganyikabacteria bacterium]